MVIALVFFIAAYFVGSIPTGYLLVKAREGVDLRTIGSGSTGATNAGRYIYNKYHDAHRARRMFFAVLGCDMAKGALPVLLALLLTTGDWCCIAAAVGAIAGHSLSCFLDFKGGKSVATGWGTIAVFAPLAWVVSFLLWYLITHTTKYVSIASIAAFAVAPLLMWAFGASTAQINYSVVLALYVISLHRDNIERLKKKEENRTEWL